MRELRARVDLFPIRGSFTIARGARTEACVVTVEVLDQQTGLIGRGECVPYAHYGETTDQTLKDIHRLNEAVAAGLSRAGLLEKLPAGAARNGVDAALWDLECKAARESDQSTPIEQELGQPAPAPVRTLRTLSLASPFEMAKEAEEVASHFDTLKLKLGGEPGELDLERVAAVRAAAPQHRLIVDANESWSRETVEEKTAALVPFDLALVEQPLPAGNDQVLGEFDHPIPFCADESFHTLADLDRAARLYDVVNLKLDKTGGLTHALEIKRAARKRGLELMVGCMVGTSLGMAPALVLAQGIDYVDLDGPFLLAEDRSKPLRLSQDGWLEPSTDCWS